jgi:hypothetical protein
LRAIRVFQLHYLAVLLRELLVGADDVVEVRVHELRGHVHVVERLRDRRRDHVPDANDLLFVRAQMGAAGVRLHIIMYLKRKSGLGRVLYCVRLRFRGRGA